MNTLDELKRSYAKADAADKAYQAASKAYVDAQKEGSNWTRLNVLAACMMEAMDAYTSAALALKTDIGLLLEEVEV